MLDESMRNIQTPGMRTLDVNWTFDACGVNTSGIEKELKPSPSFKPICGAPQLILLYLKMANDSDEVGTAS